MVEEHKKSKDSVSVENNLSSDYVPKSKLGNLPSNSMNSINAEMQKKMEKTKKDMESFQKKLSEKFKYIGAVGVVPAQASKKIEEEYEISEEDAKKGLIHTLVIIPEKKFKEIGKVRLEAINLAKSINEKIWVHVMTPVDVWNLCLDSKFDVVEAFGMSMPILDKGLLGALRVTTIHRSLVLRKFEKYVTSYVIGGSIVRGDTKSTSDIDVGIIIDDTDVKRMNRTELKERLRGVVYSYIQEAEAMSGVKNKLSPQVWLLTEFWDGVKDAHPIFFTFLRDGVPLYDRGTFLPWKSLLRMGKIKPSPEAIDMFMSSGDKLKETINKRIFDIATLDLFWGISTPTQGLLMLYGKAPGNVYDTVKEFKEIFVKKEKLIEEKYANIMEEIFLGVWKKYEHGKLKPGDVNGKELDRLAANAIDYVNRLKELRTQIEKRVAEKTIEQIYEDLFGMLESILNKKSESAVIKEFNEKYIKTGQFPQRYLKGLKLVAETRKKVKKGESEGKAKGNAKGKGKKDTRHSIEVDKARKASQEIIDSLIEYNQRCDMISMERAKFMIKGKDFDAEVFFLDNVFVVQKGKIEVLKGQRLVNSNTEDLQKQLTEHQKKQVKINFDSLETLRKIFGDFELVS